MLLATVDSWGDVTAHDNTKERLSELPRDANMLVYVYPDRESGPLQEDTRQYTVYHR